VFVCGCVCVCVHVCMRVCVSAWVWMCVSVFTCFVFARCACVRPHVRVRVRYVLRTGCVATNARGYTKRLMILGGGQSTLPQYGYLIFSGCTLLAIGPGLALVIRGVVIAAACRRGKPLARIACTCLSMLPVFVKQAVIDCNFNIPSSQLLLPLPKFHECVACYGRTSA